MPRPTTAMEKQAARQEETASKTSQTHSVLRVTIHYTV